MKASCEIEAMERTGLLWVRERSTVFWRSWGGEVERTDILRSAVDIRSWSGTVLAGVVQGVLEGVTWTARMLEGDVRELMEWHTEGAGVGLLVGLMGETGTADS